MINKLIKIFNLDVNKIIDVPESYSSTVNILLLNSGEKVVLKIPFNKTKLYREKIILQTLNGVLPVPELLNFYSGISDIPGALLLSYIDGEPIVGDINSELSFECGALLGQLHEIRMDNYCLGDNPSQKWWPSIYNRFNLWIDECKSIVDDNVLHQAIGVFHEMTEHMKEDYSPVLVHFDFRPGNILIRENKIVGLIDFESSRGGSADLDFTKMNKYMWDKYEGSKEAFIAGYESIRELPDIEHSLPVYDLYNAIGALAWCVRRNKLDDPFFYENLNIVKKYI